MARCTATVRSAAVLLSVLLAVAAASPASALTAAAATARATRPRCSMPPLSQAANEVQHAYLLKQKDPAPVDMASKSATKLQKINVYFHIFRAGSSQAQGDVSTTYLSAQVGVPPLNVLSVSSAQISSSIAPQAPDWLCCSCVMLHSQELLPPSMQPHAAERPAPPSQVVQLNVFYNKHGFNFKLAGITRTTSHTLYSSMIGEGGRREWPAKSKTHRGSWDSLNVWVLGGSACFVSTQSRQGHQHVF